jgi:hypothetical protein
MGRIKERDSRTKGRDCEMRGEECERLVSVHTGIKCCMHEKCWSEVTMLLNI